MLTSLLISLRLVGRKSRPIYRRWEVRIGHQRIANREQDHSERIAIPSQWKSPLSAPVLWVWLRGWN